MLPSPPPPPKPAFNWSRGLLHAAIALVIILAAFGVLAVTLPVADPHRFGEGVGRFSFFMGLGALGVSALAQTGRRIAAWVVGGLLVVLVLGLAAALLAMATERGAEAQARPLPTDDLVRADGVLRHPSLGFSIPDPGASLQLDPGFTQQVSASVGDGRAWVYSDPSSDEMVTVMLFADGAGSERSFTDLFDGMTRGLAQSMTEHGNPGEVRERSIRWSERRAHVYFVAGGTFHMRNDAFVLPGGRALVLVSKAPNVERFAALAHGVRTP